jgi:hypothetical protein
MPCVRRSSFAGLLGAIIGGVLLTAAILASVSRDRYLARPPTEIFVGITYGREQLQPSPEGNGVVHWARIDLSAPGIAVYVTPLDPAAFARGWEYRLRRVGAVAEMEQLALAVNGTLFTTASSWLMWMPGEFARSVETAVADHVVNHVAEDASLMWFEDDLSAHLDRSKLPSAAALVQAKWGIGGQAAWLSEGKLWPGSERTPDARTAIAIDSPRRLLFLAVGENISHRLILQKLADLGAKDGMLLDGGHSSTLAIGKGARGLAAGDVYGGWWPVATQFGIRAKPLP